MVDLLGAFSKMDIFTALNTASSLGLALFGFYFSFSLQAAGIVGSVWFTSLRVILGAIAIAAVSNLYTILILGRDATSPTQLCFNMSVLSFFIWLTAYYARNIAGCGTSLTKDQVKDFIATEHEATFVEKTNDVPNP